MSQLALGDDLEPPPRPRDAAAQLRRLNAALAKLPPPPEARTTCFVCGSPCPAHLLGHAACTGRRAA